MCATIYLDQNVGKHSGLSAKESWTNKIQIFSIQDRILLVNPTIFTSLAIIFFSRCHLQFHSYISFWLSETCLLPSITDVTGWVPHLRWQWLKTIQWLWLITDTLYLYSYRNYIIHFSMECLALYGIFWPCLSSDINYFQSKVGPWGRASTKAA